MTLEELTPGARVLGVLPDQPVTVVAAEWHGTQALTLTYRDETGTRGHIRDRAVLADPERR